MVPNNSTPLIRTCDSSHQKVESNFPDLESGLILVTCLANRVSQGMILWDGQGQVLRSLGPLEHSCDVPLSSCHAGETQTIRGLSPALAELQATLKPCEQVILNIKPCEAFSPGHYVYKHMRTAPPVNQGSQVGVIILLFQLLQFGCVCYAAIYEISRY